jgi:hypothetical protein
MPGYREILTLTERMALVKYLRTFRDPLARQFPE